MQIKKPFDILKIPMTVASQLSDDQLVEMAYESLLNLVSEEGINASGKHEIYGCIFGRDSAITILKILRFIQTDRINKTIDVTRLTELCKRTLLTLAGLQGTVENIESGEQPGKFIHEYRKDKFDHLLQLSPAWYIYPDGKLRNYDSVDSTALGLLAMYRYYMFTKDAEFLFSVLPNVERGLKWMMSYGDMDADYLVEYEFAKARKSGGLLVQSWTDSHESLRNEKGIMPLYPIAPVEVQGYTWLALRVWADFYSDELIRKDEAKSMFAKVLQTHAEKMKQRFNERFMYKDESGLMFPSQALDGRKDQIKTVTGNPLLLLWATYQKDGKRESILDESFIPDLVRRSFMSDMFDETAGIRTMSSMSHTYNPNQDSYHNGSFWPKLNSMCYEGLRKWDYLEEAKLLKQASVNALSFFNSPIELYIKNKDGMFVEFRGPTGQVSCREQAWSAGAMFVLVS